MEMLGNGLITLANGALQALFSLADPITISAVLLLASLAWFALVDTDHLNRQGNKPVVGRH